MKKFFNQLSKIFGYFLVFSPAIILFILVAIEAGFIKTLIIFLSTIAIAFLAAFGAFIVSKH